MDHHIGLKFPVEILQKIFTNIDDQKTLLNLCLAGNYTFLSIAELLLWRDVHWQWDASLLKDGDESDPHQEQFRLFCSNKKRVQTVQILRVTVFGLFDTSWEYNCYGTLLDKLVSQELPNFVNVAHTTVNFSRASRHSLDSVGKIVCNLPAVSSLRLEGCSCWSDHIRKTFPSNLRIISLWYCVPLYVIIARDAPNLEVIELIGGDGLKFLECEPEREDVYGAYTVFAAFSARLMIDKAERRDRPRLVNGNANDHDEANEDQMQQRLNPILRRFAILCLHHLMNCDCIDRHHVVRYFHNDISHPDLEELLVDVPLHLDQYYELVTNVDAPNLQKIFIQLKQSSDSESENTTEIALGEPFAVSFRKFLHLNELWLPVQGLDLSLTLQTFDIQSNNSLKQLYFNKPILEDAVDLKTLARSYASRLPSLQSVGWKRVGIFLIERKSNSNNSDIRITQKSWVLPIWLKFGQFGP